MPTTTFDTLGYAKKLESAGFTRMQAEAQAEIILEQTEQQRTVIQSFLAERQSQLASKTDLKELELRLLKWQLGIGLAIIVIMAKGFGWLGF